jgi:D-sedoheptulose 7-phosphate isomerase
MIYNSEKTEDYFEEIKRRLDDVESQIGPFVMELYKAYQESATIFIIGNGGSAANASHFAQDLAKGTLADISQKKRIKAVSLTDNGSFITALANDEGYENIFLQQLMTYAEPKDRLVVISGSGNSPNVVKATEYALDNGIEVLGVTGFDGGEIKGLSKINVHIPSNDMGLVEAVHSVVFHLTMSQLAAMLAMED